MNSFKLSALLIGACTGSLVSARLAHYIVGWLVTGRIIVGVGIGISSYIAPLYISEISPPHRRGALVSLNQLAITIGIFFPMWWITTLLLIPLGAPCS